MGVRDDTLEMLRNGFSPKEITKARRVNIKTTLAYLDELVGKGILKCSDILFSIPKDIRSDIEQGVHADYEDLLVVQKYASRALGDMYEDISTIETMLHHLIRVELQQVYGEQDWWRKGIPLPIRQNCQSRREEDDEPVTDPYCYTDLLDLWQILDKEWGIFKQILPKEATANKQELRSKFIQLNSIRRNVMHPVRGVAPSEGDFKFVRELRKLLVQSE